MQQLDSRTTFVLHKASQLFIWVGSRAQPEYTSAARAWATQLHLYEHAAADAELVSQGEETPSFWTALGCTDAEPSVQRVGKYDDDYGVGKCPILPVRPERQLQP